jgi:hypothetical protein
MGLYRINIKAAIDVDAENVVQAKEVAEDRVRLVGQCGGGKVLKNNRDLITYGVRISEFEMSNPIRMKSAEETKRKNKHNQEDIQRLWRIVAAWKFNSAASTVRWFMHGSPGRYWSSTEVFRERMRDYRDTMIQNKLL